MKTYIVETRMGVGFGYWENVWHSDDKPETFETHAQALEALEEFQRDLQEADMAVDFDFANYRIVQGKDS